MNDNGFIFLLSLGAALLTGIVAVAHVSAHRLSKRLAERRANNAAKEPELDLGDLGGTYGAAQFKVGKVILHPEMRV